MAGGLSDGGRLDNAELLIKGGSAWREVNARLPVGAVSWFSGVNLNNKVYLIGKNIQRLDTCVYNRFIFKVDLQLQRFSTISWNFNQSQKLGKLLQNLLIPEMVMGAQL